MARFGLLDSDLDSSTSSEASENEELPMEESYLASKKAHKSILKSTVAPASNKKLKASMTKARKSRVITAYSSSSESDSASGSAVSSADSEEEAHPVERRGKRVNGRKANPQSLAIWSALDAWEIHEESQKGLAWTNAAQHWQASAAAFSSIDSAQQSKDQAAQLAKQREINAVASLLEDLQVSRRKEEENVHKNFELRNAQLWEDIEAAIRVREEEELRLQQEEQAALTRARAAKEQAEAEAAKLREDQAKKQQQQEIERKAKEQKLAIDKVNAEKAEKASQAASEYKDNWSHWHNVMVQIKTNVLPPVSQNPTWKKACRDAKRAITPKVGQLTNSARHIAEISQQISATLNTLRQLSPEAYTWGLNHVSKSLLKQAEMEVTARIEVAFPLGRLAIALVGDQGHGELADVLMARFVKKCFWITGYYPPRSLAESPEAHLKLLGYLPPSQQEPLMNYAARMAGLMSLYISILSVAPLSPAVPPQFRPSAAWKLLIALFQPPLVALEPTPQLIESICSVLGVRLQQLYGQQFTKLWMCLKTQGLDQGKAGFNPKDTGWAKASCAKLSLLLEEWQKKGIAEAPGSKVDP